MENNTEQDKFWYQLTNPQSLHGLASVIQTLEKGGSVIDIDFVIREHPTNNALKPNYTVHTQGKSFKPDAYTHGQVADNYNMKDFVF